MMERSVAEVYRLQHRLIELFGGLQGSRDRVLWRPPFRPQTGYCNSIEEEAAALVESLGNNHGFLDDDKRIAFTATDVFLRRNAFSIEVDATDGHAFSCGSMDRHDFRLAQILDWIRRHIKPLFNSP
ncbi:MAG TPA: type II toxin-antitoxin system death-on-curing family toxin [Candidatus Polarisedimenticolia bacterium]|nr:type II toxin-antitoxin system death-on-curing family toxin [Candidatus Polarisedimenticolia bacterium]